MGKIPAKFTPIITLLARNVPTTRADEVQALFPLLGCPYIYFEALLAPDLIRQLDRVDHPAGLWEILDLCQTKLEWNRDQLIRLVRSVEDIVPRSIVDKLQLEADIQTRENDLKLSRGVELMPGVTLIQRLRNGEITTPPRSKPAKTTSGATPAERFLDSKAISKTCGYWRPITGGG